MSRIGFRLYAPAVLAFLACVVADRLDLAAGLAAGAGVVLLVEVRRGRCFH